MSTFLVSTDFSIYSARCTGTELSLFDCPNQSANCYSSDGAGVICEYEPPKDTIVKLVGGNNTNGNVLIDGRPIWYDEK